MELMKKKNPRANQPEIQNKDSLFPQLLPFFIGLVVILVVMTLPLPFEAEKRLNLEISTNLPIQYLWVPGGDILSINLELNPDWATEIRDGTVLEIAGHRLVQVASSKTLRLESPPGAPDLVVVAENLALESVVKNHTVRHPGFTQNLEGHLVEIRGPQLDLISTLEVEFLAPHPSYLGWRFALWLLAAGLVTAAFLRLRKEDRAQIPLDRKVRPSANLSDEPPQYFKKLVSAALALYGVLYAVLGAPKHDDGWVQHRALSFLHRGFFGAVYSNDDALVPQGWLPELATSLLGLTGAEGVHFRLISVLFWVASWIVLLATISPQNALASSRFGLLAMAATWAIFGSTFLIGLRPETFVVFVGSLFLFFATRFFNDRSVSSYLAALFFGGLGFVSHQSGLALLGPAVFLVLTALMRAESRNFRNKIWVLNFTAGFFLLVTLFVPGSPNVLSKESLNFLTTTHTPQLLLGELNRLGSLFSFELPSLSLVFVTGSLVGSLWVEKLLEQKGRPSIGNFVASQNLSLAIMASLWPIGLVLTSTKWEWHYAVLGITFVVLLGVLKPLRPKGNGNANGLIPAVGIFLALGVGVTLEPLYIRNVQGFSIYSVAGQLLNEPLFTLLLVSTGTLTVLFLSRLTILSLFQVSVGAQVFLALVPLVLGAGTTIWSRGPSPADTHISQLGFLKDSTCTDIAGVNVVTGVKVPEITGSRTGSNLRRSSELTPWGIPTIKENAQQRVFAFRGKAGDHVGLWFKSSETHATSVVLNGTEHVLSISNKPDLWQLKTLELEEGANELEISPGSPALATIPVQVIQEPASNLKPRSIFRAPNWFGLNDCLSSVVLNAPVLSGVTYFGEPYSMDPHPPIFEISIQTKHNEQDGRRIYKTLAPLTLAGSSPEDR